MDNEEQPQEREEPRDPDPCQELPEPSGGSRYKRGRRWWEQSKWERKR